MVSGSHQPSQTQHVDWGGLVVDGGPSLPSRLNYLLGAYGALLSGLLTSPLCSFLGEYHHHLDSVAQFLLWSLPLGSWHSPLNITGRPVFTGSLGLWSLSFKNKQL